MIDLEALCERVRATPSADALDVMRLSLMDWVAVGRAARQEPVTKIMRKHAQNDAGAPQTTLFFGGQCPARMAALGNGTITHALDFDDTHFAHIGHPSVAVFPTVMALAEREGASFDQMLDAALAGAECSVRLGVAFGRGHYNAGFHQTATAGAFGASLGAGVILGLDATQMAHALGLVSTRAAGLKAQFGTMGKPYNAGQAASAGVEAAPSAMVAGVQQARPPNGA